MKKLKLLISALLIFLCNYHLCYAGYPIFKVVFSWPAKAGVDGYQVKIAKTREQIETGQYSSASTLLPSQTTFGITIAETEYWGIHISVAPIKNGITGLPRIYSFLPGNFTGGQEDGVLCYAQRVDIGDVNLLNANYRKTVTSGTILDLMDLDNSGYVGPTYDLSLTRYLQTYYGFFPIF